MNVLVLGGNGYLGSKITRKLIEHGNNVVCTKREESKTDRLDDINYKIKWIHASAESIEEEINNTKFDYVINLVCNYGRGYILYDNVIEANIEFPLRVLNLAVKEHIRNFITIGTGLPQNFNMYSFSKKKFSDFGRFYVNNHNVNFCNLLLEMFYCFDEPEDRFLPSVIHSMIKGEEVNVTLGTQHRDIIAVEDIVNAVMLVFNKMPSGYNEIPVGTGIGPTISEVIDYIWEHTGKKSRVNKGAFPMRKDEPDCIADISLISELGEWHPIFWKDGISDMIKKIEHNMRLLK